MGMFDVDDLTNKVDVGSQPGTMWSLSSQKQGHGLAELRDPDSTKMWQSDGLLPHLINIQFARRTVLTHISLYMDFRLDDSYTPNKVRIYAGTYYHDLVEVRTREFVEATGWKHFVLDKSDARNESDESDTDFAPSRASTSSISSSDLDETQSIIDNTAHGEGLRGKRSRNGMAGLPHDGGQNKYLACGVAKRHTPIDAFLVQICIVSNHAAGKDTHLRGIRIFGPPTRQSRDKARFDMRMLKESRKISGPRAVQKRRKQEARQHKQAFSSLRRWAQAEGGEPSRARSREAFTSSTDTAMDGEDDGASDEEVASVPVSRRLQLLSSVR